MPILINTQIVNNCLIKDNKYPFHFSDQNEIIQTIKTHHSSKYQTNFSESAATIGHFNVLKWLHKNKYPFSCFVSDNAIKGGHLEILKWLSKHKYPIERWMCTTSILHGHLEILKWLKYQGFSLDEWDFYYAVKTKNYSILNWLIKNNCPCHSESLSQLINEKSGLILSITNKHPFTKIKLCQQLKLKTFRQVFNKINIHLYGAITIQIQNFC